jgi:hypothetical protein
MVMKLESLEKYGKALLSPLAIRLYTPNEQDNRQHQNEEE